MIFFWLFTLIAHADPEVYLEQQSQLCSELGIHRWRVVTGEQPNTSLAWSRPDHMNYVIKRLDEKKYLLVFHLEFEVGFYLYQPEDPQYLFADFKADTIKRMKEHIQKCFRDLSGQVKDRDGVEFEFAMNDGDLSEKIPATRIGIERKNFRGYQYRYAMNISCSQVHHELLHLAGLVDEYHEKDTTSGYRKNSKGEIVSEVMEKVRMKDCRPPVNKKTLMSKAALLDSFSEIKTVQRLCLCQKPGHCDDPIFNLDHLRRRDVPCPKTFTDQPQAYPELMRQLRRVGVVDAHNVYHPEFVTVEMIKSVSRPAVFQRAFFLEQDVAIKRATLPLSPTHTRHLIYPGCDSKNEEFYTCARAANETSVLEGCSELPKYCSEGNWIE